MQLQSFGYFGVKSQKLDDWAEYGPKFLGLEVVERTPTTLKLRMDDGSSVSSFPPPMQT
ncbi:MAG: hypothetical protein R3D67_17240 [Hyphomicrobiaceae bacterium]